MGVEGHAGDYGKVYLLVISEQRAFGFGDVVCPLSEPGLGVAYVQFYLSPNDGGQQQCLGILVFFDQRVSVHFSFDGMEQEYAMGCLETWVAFQPADCFCAHLMQGGGCVLAQLFCELLSYLCFCHLSSGSGL